MIKALLLIGPDSSSGSGGRSRRTRARNVMCHFMKALGQLMMLTCDCLIVQRIAQGGGTSLIVSLMCPIFHIHVALLDLLGAIHAMFHPNPNPKP